MYRLNLGAWNAVFAVPCSVVDQHIKLAGSVQLKVLLWVLRHAGESFTEETIAQALSARREDISDALLYWQETGVLSKEGEAFSPAAQPAQPAPVTAQEETPKAAAPEQEKKPIFTTLPRPPLRHQRPDNAFIAKRVTESSEIAYLMQEAERITGRLLNNGLSGTLLMLHDDYGLPTDVLLMLLQYTASVGKTNMRYIERVGMDWAEEEIFSHERAEDKLRRIAENTKAWHLVEQALGLAKRSPSAKEEAFANRWVNEWHFSSSMIREAYERCVNTKGQLSFSYMNGIMMRWNAQGITTLQQAQEEQAKKASAQKKEKQHDLTYDIEEYERSGAFDHFDGK